MGVRPRMVDLVRQAVTELAGKGRPASNKAIQSWIRQRYPDANFRTISCTVMLCSVTVQARVNYPENRNVPVKRHPDYDTLYKVGRSQYVLFDPQEHGRWGIERRDGKFVVIRIEDGEKVIDHSTEAIREQIKGAQLKIGAVIAAGGSADDPAVKQQKRNIERLTLELNDLEGSSRSVLSHHDKVLVMQMFDLARKALPHQAQFESHEQKEQQLWELVKRPRA